MEKQLRTYVHFRWMRVPVLLALCLALLTIGAYAQGGATLIGTVTDSTGAAVIGAKITITNTDNGFIRNTETNEAGIYTARDLVIGHYKIRVESPGFKVYEKTEITLNVGATVRADAALQVGGQQESVTVEATAIQVQSETNEVSQTVTAAQVSELATNGRNLIQLTALVPGAASQLPDFDLPVAQYQNRSVSFNGQRNDHNNWLIDGGEAYDRGGGGILIVSPSQDAIQEFKIATSNYSADMGQSSGGMISMAIKQGTKNYHGAGWEYVRNDYLNAWSWKAKDVDPGQPVKKDVLRYNTWGFNFGGPLNPKADNPKTFFFYNMEWRRYRKGDSSGKAALTAAQKNGANGVYDLSGLLKTPTSTIKVPTNLSDDELNRLRTAFPGINRGADIPNATIPASLVDPNAAAFLATGNFPVGNTSVGGNPQYLVSADTSDKYREEIVRLDRQFSDKLTVMGHLIWDSGVDHKPTPLWAGMTYPTIGTDAKVPSWSAVVHATYTMSPALLLELSYNHNGNNLNIDPVLNGGTYLIPSGWNATQFFPNVNGIGKLPSLDIRTGGSGTMALNYDIGRWPWNNTWRSSQWKGDMSWSHASHNVRFGAGFMRFSKMQFTDANIGGNYQFDGSATGMGYADFLLGYANNYKQPMVRNAVTIAANTYSLYAIDDWKVSRRLTLNLGVRWEGLPPAYDVNGRLANFYPSLYNPAQAGTFVGTNALDPNGPGFTLVSGIPLDSTKFYMNGIGISGRDGTPKGMVDNTWNTFAPRVGFAYDLTGKGTVLRGGFGMFYERTAGNEQYNMMNNTPFLYTPSVDTVLLKNPNINYQTGASSAAAYPIAGITGAAFKHDVPTTNMWNLGIQQDIKGKAVLDVSYVGNSAYHQTDTIPINNLAESDPNRLSICKGATGCLGQPANPLRPYQGWSNINVVENAANAHYNSLQASLRTSSWKDLTLSASWTYAHGFDMVDGELWNNLNNPVNKAYNWGSSGFDRRHVVNLSYVYSMPFFRHSENKFVKSMLGGWTLSGISLFSSGNPLTVNNTSSGDTLGYGGNTTNLANKVAPVSYPNTKLAWFSGASFAPVTSALTWGNSGRSSVIGPGRNNWNISLFKKFQITERVGFEFRAESFNAFNHTQYTTIDTGMNSKTYGQATDAAQPRMFQLGARLSF